MRVYIAVKCKSSMPGMRRLAAYMWARGIELGYARSGRNMAESTYVSLTWAKWVDNPKWRGHPKNKEYIDLEWASLERVKTRVSREFYRLAAENQMDNVLIIQVANDAVTMDRRAFARAVYRVAQRTGGRIYVPVQKKILDAGQYYEENRELIESEFSMDFEPPITQAAEDKVE